MFKIPVFLYFLQKFTSSRFFSLNFQLPGFFMVPGFRATLLYEYIYMTANVSTLQQLTCPSPGFPSLSGRTCLRGCGRCFSPLTSSLRRQNLPPIRPLGSFLRRRPTRASPLLQHNRGSLSQTWKLKKNNYWVIRQIRHSNRSTGTGDIENYQFIILESWQVSCKVRYVKFRS